MLLEAGFSESMMSTVMALGPLFALVLLPVMGMLSDQCKSRYGRRKPFIFALSVGITISLILLPYSTNVGSLLSAILPSGESSSIFLLAFSVVLLDFCTQVAYTPIESLLSDPCETEDQQNKSFSVFTFMLSIGACLGYWVTAIDWSNTSLGLYFGGQEHTLFAILLVTFMCSSAISLFIIDDPQEEDSDYEELHEISSVRSNGSISSSSVVADGQSVKRSSSTSTVIPNNNSIVSTTTSPLKKPTKDIVELPPFSLGTFIRSPHQYLLLHPCVYFASLLPTLLREPILDTIESLRTMPAALRYLWVSDFFACTGLMGFRLYFTDYVGEAIYHGNPDSEPGSVGRLHYEQGKSWVQISLGRAVS